MLKTNTRVKVTNPSSAQEEHRDKLGTVKAEAASSTPQMRQWKVVLDGNDYPTIFKGSELEAIAKPIGRPCKMPLPAEDLPTFQAGQAVAVPVAGRGPAEGGTIWTGRIESGKVQVRVGAGIRWVPVAQVQLIASPPLVPLQPPTPDPIYIPSEPVQLTPEAVPELTPEEEPREEPEEAEEEEPAADEPQVLVVPPVPDATRPAQARVGGLPAITVIRAWGSNFEVGCALERLHQHSLQGGREEICQAIRYLEMQLERMDEEAA